MCKAKVKVLFLAILQISVVISNESPNSNDANEELTESSPITPQSGSTFSNNVETELSTEIFPISTQSTITEIMAESDFTIGSTEELTEQPRITNEIQIFSTTTEDSVHTTSALSTDHFSRMSSTTESTDEKQNTMHTTIKNEYFTTVEATESMFECCEDIKINLTTKKTGKTTLTTEWAIFPDLNCELTAQLFCAPKDDIENPYKSRQKDIRVQAIMFQLMLEKLIENTTYNCTMKLKSKNTGEWINMEVFEVTTQNDSSTFSNNVENELSTEIFPLSTQSIKTESMDKSDFTIGSTEEQTELPRITNEIQVSSTTTEYPLMTTSALSTDDFSKISSTTDSTEEKQNTLHITTEKEYFTIVEATEKIFDPCEGTKMNLTTKKTGKTILTTEWAIFADINCKLTAQLFCAPEDDPDDIRQKTIRVKNNNFQLMLQNLTKNTKYSCTMQLKSRNTGERINMEVFEVTTQNNVPSEVNFTIVNTTAKSFTLKWARPKKSPGHFINYHIKIYEVGPQHTVRRKSDEMVGKTISVFNDSKLVSYTYREAKPNYLYKIQVLTKIGERYSKGTNKSVVTKHSNSTEPLNLSSNFIDHSTHCNGTIYNVSLLIHWELPYQTNGPLEKFVIRIDSMNEIFTKEVYGNDLNYSYLITNGVLPAKNYTFSITPITQGNIVGAIAKNSTGRSPDGCPEKLSVPHVNFVTSEGFNISWMPPNNNFGDIEEYEVEIQNQGASHVISQDEECPATKENIISTQNTTDTHLNFNRGHANFKYRIRVRAKTSAGYGDYSNYKELTLFNAASDPVRMLHITRDYYSNTEEFECNVTLAFEMPCNTNGPFKWYSINYSANNYTVGELNQTVHNISLDKPEYNYTFEVQVVTEHNTSAVRAVNYVTRSGVPPVNYYKIENSTVANSANDDTPTQIDFILNRDIFSNDGGEVRYYSIILFAMGEGQYYVHNHYNFWNGTWPDAEEMCSSILNPKHVIQVTPNCWRPFEGRDDVAADRCCNKTAKESLSTIDHHIVYYPSGNKDKVYISIGSVSDCSADSNKYFCIEENSNYILIVRGFTRNAYREVYLYFKTGEKPSNPTITILLFIALFCVIVIGLVWYISRNKYQYIWRYFEKSKRRSMTTLDDDLHYQRYVINVKHFKSYYNKLINDALILKEQYEVIEEEAAQYREECVNTTCAFKPENRRKNRYTNILPYDECRVKLNICEDDEISSDYINASYIKGFSGRVEYIASQGPLENTCKDFWKMIIQENVKVIVMVTQFVEKEKEKCFRYFPNNSETMLICEDVEVKCVGELFFETNCVRTLLVRKGNRQYRVNHMQYLDWPDFGCPTGTENLLSFCQEVRDRITRETGPTIVHCSAGVGRTGTLISLDILLQAIMVKKEISIFECVLELRKQRSHMVQTQKQYIYLHTCIKDALENATKYLNDVDSKECDEVDEDIDFKLGENESVF